MNVFRGVEFGSLALANPKACSTASITRPCKSFGTNAMQLPPSGFSSTSQAFELEWSPSTSLLSAPNFQARDFIPLLLHPWTHYLFGALLLSPWSHKGDRRRQPHEQRQEPSRVRLLSCSSPSRHRNLPGQDRTLVASPRIDTQTA